MGILQKRKPLQPTLPEHAAMDHFFSPNNKKLNLANL